MILFLSSYEEMLCLPSPAFLFPFTFVQPRYHTATCHSRNVLDLSCLLAMSHVYSNFSHFVFLVNSFQRVGDFLYCASVSSCIYHCSMYLNDYLLHFLLIWMSLASIRSPENSRGKQSKYLFNKWVSGWVKGDFAMGNVVNRKWT